MNTQDGLHVPGGLRLIELKKYFRRKGSRAMVAAIDGVSMDVAPGELVVLLGPSGCGKTTILRCIAGLDTPDEGEIHSKSGIVFSGEKKISVPVNRRNISVIFQGYALWPHMTVEQNVGYPMSAIGGYRRDAIAIRVESMLGLVGVPDLAHEYPGTLSGGQQQRVSVARALVNDPPVVLFDEPLSNVDAQVRAELRRQIKAMHRRVGFSAIYVTHDQEEALSLADRVVVLRKGRIVQEGPPQEVYNSPNCKYVAEFVGRANVFPVTVTNGSTVDTPFGRIAAAEFVKHETGTQQFAVIRAEAIELAAETELASEGCSIIDAKVKSAEFLGARSELMVEANGVVLRVECPRATIVPAVDSTIRLRIKAEAVRVVPE